MWANAGRSVDQNTATIGVHPRYGRWFSGSLQKENQRHPLLHCKRINRSHSARVGAHYTFVAVPDGMLVCSPFTFAVLADCGHSATNREISDSGARRCPFASFDIVTYRRCEASESSCSARKTDASYIKVSTS